MAPSIEQLKEVIRNGNDSIPNSLVLTTNGQFELVDMTDMVPGQFNRPDVVTRYETFAVGTGYVGADAANDDVFIKNTFNAMMEDWEVYKRNGTTNHFAGI